jgi:uncharacterized Zn finger protein
MATIRTSHPICAKSDCAGPGRLARVAVPIANILHQETIRRLSGDGAFERGKTYFMEGRVVDIQRKEGTVFAKVRGTETYDVRIWMKDESLAYACVCPQGQEQAFCKHAVAVALAFLGGLPSAESQKTDPLTTDAANDDAVDRRSNIKESPKPPATRAKPIEKAETKAPEARTPTPPASPAARPAASLAEMLRALKQEDLVVICLEAALDDEAFRERLVRRLRS